MSKLEQILNIDPASELHFRGPFTEVVSSTIKLHNPSDKKVCFKVKTTAPKKYCVRPNSGIVGPQQTVNVAVMLQPHDFDPKEKSKHKFMVQSMIAQGNVDNLENIWKEASADQIIDAKLKCVFDMPEGNSSKTADPVHDQNKEQSSIVEPNITATNNSPKEVSNENEGFGSDIKTTTQQPAVISEDKSLKADNLRLKEEINVLKTEVRQRQTKSQSGGSEPTTTTTLIKNEPESQIPPILYLIIALFIGILIGKIIL